MATMMNKFKIFLFSLFFLGFFVAPIHQSLALDDNVPIREFGDEASQAQIAEALVDSGQVIKLNVPVGKNKYVTDLGAYIQLWYNFVIGSVGIMATVIIMWGGFKWLTSHGNSAMIGDAKDRIFAAITGLVIAFLSYTIFQIINPNLLNLTMPELKHVVVEVVDNARNGGVIDPFTGEPTQDDRLYIPTDMFDYTRRNEGLRLSPYRNRINGVIENFDTIGYGHRITGQEDPPIIYNEDGSISQAEAERLFIEDYQAAINGAQNNFPSMFTEESLSDPDDRDRRVVLADMTYQMGEGGMAGFTDLQAAVADENWVAAGAAILDSNYASQTPDRARRNADVMIDGSFQVFRD